MFLEKANLSGRSISEEFYWEIHRYAAHYRALGLHKAALSSKIPSGAFDQRTPDFQIKSLKALKLLNSSFDAEIKEGDQESKWVESRVLWRFIRELGLRPPSNLFSRLEDSNTIEIYGLDFIQIYRNFRFMELCSYSIEDVLTRPFDELFGRIPDQCQDQIFAAIESVTSGRVKEAIAFDLVEHVTYEKSSTEQRRFKAAGRTISPLFDDENRPAGFLATLDASQIK